MKKAKKANPTTVEEAIKNMTPLVHKFAYKWTRNHYKDREDIVQQGMMGVVHAWNKFEPERGFAFSTYAWFWIRAYIKEYAENNWNTYNHSVALMDDFDYDTVSDPWDEVDIRIEFGKLSKGHQKLIQLKTEGYTFDHIARELGYENLHKARNDYMTVCKRLGTG